MERRIFGQLLSGRAWHEENVERTRALLKLLLYNRVMLLDIKALLKKE
jgi:hypothetical protein